MGYSTDFYGAFCLNKKLDHETHEFLVKFNETRRMKRNVSAEHGFEGEFYVDGKGFMGQDEEKNIIDYNQPPPNSTQSKNGRRIEWDGGEKFYDYVTWIEYIIKNFLKPKGYILNGSVRW